MELLSSINNSGIGAQYAISAERDVNGNEITSTYITSHQALPNSANWNATYNTVNGNSGTWNSTYDTVHDNSASWTGGGVSVTSPRGTININGDEIEGTNSAVLTGTTGGYETYLMANNSYIEPNPTVLTTGNIPVTSQTGGTLVMEVNGGDPSLYITVTGQTHGGGTATASGQCRAGGISFVYIPLGEMIGPFTAQASYWANLYTPVLTASAAPTTGITGVGELAWNSALDSVRNTSANWNSTVDTVYSNSASWGAGSTYTGDAQGALDEVYSKSGTWNTVTDKLNSTAFSTVSGNFLTAVPEGYATTGDLTSKLDSTAFSDVSGSFLTAVPEGYATTGDLAGKLDTTAQVVTSITTGKLVSTGVSAINSTPILSTGVYKVGSIQIGSGDPGMYLTSQNGTAYYKANELIINRTGYGEQIKFNLGSAGSQIIGSAAGNRGAFIDMSNGSHTAFVGVLSGEDAAIVLDGVSATPNSITSWNGVVSTVSDNSASWAGGSVPEGVLVESGLEYDDTEISGYSGSAFKDVALSETVATNSGAWGGEALPISAGPGVKVELTDGKLLFSTDETVLWTGTGNATGTLSENVSSFESIKVFGYQKDSNQYTVVNECYPTGNMCYCSIHYTWNNGTNIYAFYEQIRLSGNEFSGVNGGYWRAPYNGGNTTGGINTFANNEGIKVTKVVGINRTAGGN